MLGLLKSVRFNIFKAPCPAIWGSKTVFCAAIFMEVIFLQLKNKI
jgi:hypothetical protein